MSYRISSEQREWDFLAVNPSEIEVGDMNDSDLPSNAKVVAMAISLHLHGQRQAVECRLLDDSRLLLVHGYVRTGAARLLRVGFEYTDPVTTTKTKIKNRNFKLWVAITDKVVEKPAAVCLGG